MTNRIYYSEEAEQHAKRERSLTMILFTACGMTIGAALALLFAPKSGDEIRNDLSAAINDGAETSADALKRLEREFAEFRKKFEERFGS